MSKKSTSGKAYFHAMGQRDKIKYAGHHSNYHVLKVLIKPFWPTWAQDSYRLGYIGVNVATYIGRK